jgi:hypothetical protein
MVFFFRGMGLGGLGVDIKVYGDILCFSAGLLQNTLL